MLSAVRLNFMSESLRPTLRCLNSSFRTLAFLIGSRGSYARGPPFKSSLTPVFSQHCRKHANETRKGRFRTIDGTVDTKSESFQRNRDLNLVLFKKYAEALRMATSGGDAKAVERHTKKNKKLLVTERLKLVFDDVEDVLEMMPLAGMGMKYGDVPRAGVLAAVGKIHGVHCMVVANDATVKAGTIFPITLKKQLRCFEVAQENSLPCIYIVDSGGAFLPLQADIFLPGGRSFYNQAILNSVDLPMLAIVCGSCTAGAAYVPTMTQEAIIVNKIGTIFLGGPPLVQAALGEVVSPDELGGAKLHSNVSGCTDYYAETEAEAFELGRNAVAAFNIAPASDNRNVREPVYDPLELVGLIPSSPGQLADMRKVIARIVDGSEMHEFKATYGTTIVTGFCYIEGFLVGVVGNNGVLTSDAALKASHFIQLCSQRKIPIVFLQNVTPDNSLGYGEGTSAEKAALDGVKISSQAKLMTSVACAGVPMVTVIVGNSFGFENFMMGGRSFGPRFLYCWPNARIFICDPDEILAQSQQASTDDQKAVGVTVERLLPQSTALYSSSQGWDDGIILPTDTRKVLGKSLRVIHQVQNWKLGQSAKAVMRM